ncbi:MAG: dTDP-4-dehydrorhamnose reductase [Patiriisocius sp.]|jgi:dTDP-4-dehydrorhamnose reductase
MKRVLVTGANGQLGRCLKDASLEFSEFEVIFTDRTVMDLGSPIKMADYFSKNNFDFCINAAAYTNVDKAETDTKEARDINTEGVKKLAEICLEKGTTLIHISTDYVFDGESLEDYVETDATNPINVYGASKLKGEQYIEQYLKTHYILRTSWLYSQYGHNFLNTILKHGALGTELKITTEQTGTPTNANDLANVIFKMLVKTPEYGIYHFANKGACTWYDFAKEILANSPQLKAAKLAKTDHYPTFAARPERSVLNTKKIEKALNVVAPSWTISLKGLMKGLNTQP